MLNLDTPALDTGFDMTVDEQLAQFEDSLRRLTVDYEIFFSGGRKLPPTNLKFRVETLIKRLGEEQMNFAQKFKYNQLVAKYSLYRDLWRRNMQEKEEGGKLRSEQEIERMLRAGREEATAPENPDYLAVAIEDAASNSAEIVHLYRRLIEMRRHHAEKELNIDFARFRQLVVEKTAEMRSLHRCSAAEFVVFYDPQQERVRFQVKAKHGEGPSPNPNQTLTGFVFKQT